jgi:hypothetical protein
MKTGAGAVKGAKWERYVCKRLSLWLTAGKRDDCFWRTAMSGGRATFQLRKEIVNQAQAGDMQAITAEGLALTEHYIFEHKHRHDLNFPAFLTHTGGLLTNYWRSTQQVAARLGKKPVLIAKQDRYPALVLTEADCSLFPYEPWAVFAELGVQLHDFETVTKVYPPLIKRPRGAIDGQDKTLDDRRAVVLGRHGRPEAGKSF